MDKPIKFTGCSLYQLSQTSPCKANRTTQAHVPLPLAGEPALSYSKPDRLVSLTLLRFPPLDASRAGAHAHGDDAGDGVRAAQVGGGLQGLQLRVHLGAGWSPRPRLRQIWQWPVPRSRGCDRRFRGSDASSSFFHLRLLQNAPLTEQQKAAIAALSHAVAERPFPANLVRPRHLRIVCIFCMQCLV
jgi:hypothetical protein